MSEVSPPTRPRRRNPQPVPRPFVKWAGGKSQLLMRLSNRLPRRFGTYHEPFLGSGALFFHLVREGQLRNGARLSDINTHLIDAWTAVRDDVEGLLRLLQTHPNTSEHFYEVRALDPATLDPTERAARLIFLNKTCFNGLYRENRHGQFNVPWGHNPRATVFDEANLRAVSEALRGVTLEATTFTEVLEAAKPNDFVYLDPPYAPRSKTSSFTSYHRSGFGEAEQRTLKGVVDTLSARGVQVLVSNSDTQFIVDLYESSPLKSDILKARRNINASGSARGPINEIIARNY